MLLGMPTQAFYQHFSLDRALIVPRMMIFFVAFENGATPNELRKLELARIGEERTGVSDRRVSPSR
jgi:hypothetical protein